MAKKVKIFGSFSGKVAVVKKNCARSSKQKSDSETT
jgi:hypothetical protein